MSYKLGLNSCCLYTSVLFSTSYFMLFLCLSCQDLACLKNKLRIAWQNPSSRQPGLSQLSELKTDQTDQNRLFEWSSVELSGALVTSWNQKRWEPHEFLWFLDYIDQPLYDLYDPIRIHDDSLWVPWCVQWWVQWFKGNATLLPPWHWSCFAPSIASVGDWICLGRSWKVTVVTVEVWSSGMIRPREVFALY